MSTPAYNALISSYTGFFVNQSVWSQISGPPDTFADASNFFLFRSAVFSVSAAGSYVNIPGQIYNYSTGPVTLTWTGDSKPRLIPNTNPDYLPVAYQFLPDPNGGLASDTLSLYMSLAMDGFGNYCLLPSITLNAPSFLGYQIVATRYPNLLFPLGTFNIFTQIGTISLWGQNIPTYASINDSTPPLTLESWSITINDTAPGSYFQPSDFV